jgi:hypothetical protein
MATTFKNALSPAIGTTPTIVYTAASNVKVTVLGISLANITASFVTASVTITDPGPTGTFTGNLTQNSPTISSVNTFSEVQTGAGITGTGIPANTTISSFDAVAGTVTMSNNATASGTGVTVTFSDASAVNAYYIKDVVIPPNQSLRVINGGERLVLGSSNTLSIVSNTASSLDVVVSLVEIV